MESVRVLCAADIHLGRRPARVPLEVEGVSTGDIFEEIVSAAIRRRVDAVLLAGDIVDADNQLYEAFGPLQRGVRRLSDAGIWTVAVGGNHDHAVMGRLARLVDSERWCFLGANGEWARCCVPTGDGRELEVVGWSFPSEHVVESPLRTFPNQYEPDGPTVGLVHGEFDVQRSRYAPVARGDLEQTGVRSWVFGHLHRRQTHELSGGEVVYPGSPQPLDPSETGPHGVTVLEMGDEGEPIDVEHLDLAGLAYCTTRVDISDLEGREAFEEKLTIDIEEAHRSLVQERGALRWVVHRVELVGRSADHRHLDAWSRDLEERMRPAFEGVGGTVDDVVIQTQPTFDLEALAKGDDPPGVLAELMLAAGAGHGGDDGSDELQVSDELDGLIRSLGRDLRRNVYSRNAYAPLRSDEETAGEPTRAEILEMVKKTGWALLEELMSQREGRRDDEASRGRSH